MLTAKQQARYNEFLQEFLVLNDFRQYLTSEMIFQRFFMDDDFINEKRKFYAPFIFFPFYHCGKNTKDNPRDLKNCMLHNLQWLICCDNTAKHIKYKNKPLKISMQKTENRRVSFFPGKEPVERKPSRGFTVLEDGLVGTAPRLCFSWCQDNYEFLRI